MRKITLCADDFGQNAAISKGIIDLVFEKRLSAVSCMTNCLSFQEHANELKKFSKQIDIGLHFNLTHEKLLTPCNQQKPFALNALLLQAFFRKLSFEEISNEMSAQLQMFIKHFNCLPDFIDGHQHIHQFPIIRDALIATCKKLMSEKIIYIRLPGHFKLKTFLNIKKKIIFLTGAFALKKQLMKNNIPYNHSFSGIYHFKNATYYRDYFLIFLTEVDDKGLIMCHPGEPSEDHHDPLKNYRVHEYNYLRSQQFIDDCKTHNIQLAPFLGGK